MSSTHRAGSFKSMGLSDEIVRAIDKLGFKHPTPIQRRAIPAILTGVDSVAMARTGSGKTAAFAIPTISRLGKHSEIVGARAIVLSPTRELAMQTCKVFQLLARYTDLRIALIVGGHSMEGQFDRLMNNPDIIIATPGRLIHHLEQDGGFSLDRVEMLVLDEADRLFELGLSDQIGQLLKACPSGRQALLFSATLPSQLVRFAKAGLQSPDFIRLDAECSLSDDLELHMAFTRAEAKPAALVSVIRALRSVRNDPRSIKKTIVFVATRHHVDFLGPLIEKANVATVACIYGSMDQLVRSAALADFRAGKAQVMVVTDVAARGIDIPDVDNVIHYDFPCSPKLFIHRSGRTARAGRSGFCVSMVTAGDMPYLWDLVLFIDAKLVVAGEAESAPAPESADGMIVEIDLDGGEQKQKAQRKIEIGAIPYVDEDVEMVARMVEDDSELHSGKRSMDLSMGPYFKTRPSASKHAVKSARNFVDNQCGGQQRLLGLELSWLSHGVASSSVAVSSIAETDRDAILARLRSFRPSQTMGQSGLAASSAVKSDTRKLLQSKLENAKLVRRVAAECLDQDGLPHDHELDEDMLSETESEKKPVAKPIRAKKEKKTDFKCKEFFHTLNVVSNEVSAQDRGFDLEQHRMDLVPETHDELNAKARYGRKWDSKKMNYVSVRIGADGKAIKNESGQKLSKKDKEKGKHLYKDWARKSKKRIPRTGEVETAGDAAPFRPSDRKESVARGPKAESSIQTPKSVSSKNYHGDVPWNFLTNKQKRLETRKLKSGAVTSRGNERNAQTLKTPESIAKARGLKSTRQTLQNPKKRKEYHKESKAAYRSKQDAKIKATAAPTRSWVKGQKTFGRR